MQNCLTCNLCLYRIATRTIVTNDFFARSICRPAIGKATNLVVHSNIVWIGLVLVPFFCNHFYNFRCSNAAVPRICRPGLEIAILVHTQRDIPYMAIGIHNHCLSTNFIFCNFMLGFSQGDDIQNFMGHFCRADCLVWEHGDPDTHSVRVEKHFGPSSARFLGPVPAINRIWYGNNRRLHEYRRWDSKRRVSDVSQWSQLDSIYSHDNGESIFRWQIPSF